MDDHRPQNCRLRRFDEGRTIQLSGCDVCGEGVNRITTEGPAGLVCGYITPESLIATPKQAAKQPQNLLTVEQAMELAREIENAVDGLNDILTQAMNKGFALRVNTPDTLRIRTDGKPIKFVSVRATVDPLKLTE